MNWFFVPNYSPLLIPYYSKHIWKTIYISESNILELFQNNPIKITPICDTLRLIERAFKLNGSIISKLLKMIFSRPKCPLKRRSSLKNSVENYHVFPKKIFKRCPKTTYTIRSRFLSNSKQFSTPHSRVPKVYLCFPWHFDCNLYGNIQINPYMYR